MLKRAACRPLAGSGRSLERTRVARVTHTGILDSRDISALPINTDYPLEDNSGICRGR